MSATVSRSAGLAGELVAERLVAWQPALLAAAARRPLWSNIASHELEDLYAVTSARLYDGTYADEDHLRAMIWTGLAHRAMDLHRTRGRQMPTEEMEALAGPDPEPGPAEQVQRLDDYLLAADLLSELSEPEGQVFKLLHGERYKRREVAAALRLSMAEVQKLERTADRKLQNIVTVHAAGRLCSKRTLDLAAVSVGAASETEARRAEAHLAHCRSCRRDNARTRARVGRKAAALLPMPLLLGSSTSAAGKVTARIGERIPGNHPRLTETTDAVIRARSTGVGAGIGTGATLKVLAAIGTTAAAVTGAGVAVLDQAPQHPKKVPVSNARTRHAKQALNTTPAPTPHSAASTTPASQQPAPTTATSPPPAPVTTHKTPSAGSSASSSTPASGGEFFGSGNSGSTSTSSPAHTSSSSARTAPTTSAPARRAQPAPASSGGEFGP